MAEPTPTTPAVPDPRADASAPTASSTSTTPSGPSRPTTASRPRTGHRRPRTVRPDTSASGIGEGELPDQTFFPEGDDFDEDEEYEDDEPEDGDVFAFARPITAAPGAAATSGSEYTTSVPNTGVTGHTGNAPTTARTDVTGGTFGFIGGLRHTPASIAPTGNIDVGGHLPLLTYDVAHPPPFAGKNNLNNASFAFSMSSRGSSRPDTGISSRMRPSTGRSLLDRIYRRHITTVSTGMTGMTDGSGVTGETRTSLDSGVASEEGSFTTETTGFGARPRPPRRIRSSAPLIPGSGTGDIIGEGTNRGMSRGSYGMTELTGDVTVPDGKVTWGDGMGNFIKEDSDGGDISLQGMDLDMVEEDSPYPEVRASVSNIDDPEMPALTIRVWMLGLFFVVIASACNTFFHFRTPAPYISPLVVQLVAYPCGKFLAWILPIRTYNLPSWLGGMSFSFNPGPFNIKEHALVAIMSNVSIGPAYALYATVSAELWYQKDFGVGFEILFILATQLTGFTMAGLCRRFVVWPASMIWPGNLVVATTLNAFHAEEPAYSGSISRFKFLMLVAGGAFIWYWIPGFLFTALSYFSFACWIAPRNRVVNELFGVSTGLGMSVLTFDWTQIAWIGSPLATPWWASVNVGIGFVLFYWILVPILYYCNVWQFAYLPISVTQLGDRFGSSYNVFNILTPDIQLNTTAYALYSPVYLSASFSMTFMLAFALSSALIVHTILHHGQRIYRAAINLKTEADDIHMKLMRHYPEVPDWWFLALFGVVFVFAVVAIEVFNTGLPVWGYLVAVLLPLIYVVPSSFIYAMTGQQIAINLIAELIPGYIFQGQPIPGMIFKVFSVQTITEAMTFVQDQKLGHYIKLPPRATFVAQLSATSIAAFVQIGTKQLLFAAVPDICGSNQRNLLTCASTKVFFTSSVIWGLVGPERLFSKGALYYPQVYAALAGAILPIPLWLWVRKYPRSIFRNMNFPVIFNGALSIPPATGVNYASWFATGFIFQFWIRRTKFAWWSKYNYVLSAALDVGTAFSAIAIFLFIDLPGASLNWWGNTVFQNTADWTGEGAAYLVTPPEGFGPSTWKV